MFTLRLTSQMCFIRASVLTTIHQACSRDAGTSPRRPKVFPHDQRRPNRTNGEGGRAYSEDELGRSEEDARGAREAVQVEAGRDGKMEGMYLNTLYKYRLPLRQLSALALNSRALTAFFNRRRIMYKSSSNHSSQLIHKTPATAGRPDSAHGHIAFDMDTTAARERFRDGLCR